ncbi:hypothetical protein [Haliangium sp.]|uniref:hypothetical protein n=1 Tax=Haliangium sp. TaxID=2663208 RepID=UPI003D0A01B5
MSRTSSPAAPPSPPPPGQRWLFSARVDIGVFLGSALASLALMAVGAHLGLLSADAPEWTWVTTVLLIDVAHVWTTGFRVYLDRDEMRRRPHLYLLTPLFVWILGVALYSEGPGLFWCVLAYAAVFHFVRQQYGWVALYRARVGERGRLGRWLDTAVIYAATCYPLLYWHANLPRAFAWMLPGDFVSLPALLGVAVAVAEPIYWALMGAYLVRAAASWLGRAGTRNPGKDIVVITTAACWYLGIVGFDSDYAFTVTNVIIHGVPYFALVYWYGRRRLADRRGGRAMRVFAHGPWLFVGLVWAAAYVEELLWHRLVWHERTWLFGASWDDLAWLQVVIVPLLALPQATHYILDGFIWRRRSNPDLPLA